MLCLATLLYAPLTLYSTSDSIFFPCYALSTFSQNYNSAFIIAHYLHAIKCVFSSSPYFSTRYTIHFVTSDSSA